MLFADVLNCTVVTPYSLLPNEALLTLSRLYLRCASLRCSGRIAPLSPHSSMISLASNRLCVSQPSHDARLRRCSPFSTISPTYTFEKPATTNAIV